MIRLQPFKYSPKLNTGRLNRRIVIQEKGGSKDAAGYPIPNQPWEDVTTVWASRETLRGREFFAAAAAQHEKTIRFKIRYREDIKAGMRIIEKGRIYEIYAALDDPKGDRSESHLMTTEKANG
ncbi:phage head closure protein [Paenibacillus alvei]|uniref:phage head closure protein n=1 Tax=Paenibacillus alvei TaxID=44250 RepID=UPI0018CD5C2A|nr:phage head closure protein [Paenibacillus alvei]MCY9579557.1 phage head closure protein [Paenibacillus alvei]MCY9586517.1 phage head closure protein [Paenibacillus alvei]